VRNSQGPNGELSSTRATESCEAKKQRQVFRAFHSPKHFPQNPHDREEQESRHQREARREQGDPREVQAMLVRSP
jgi:hypothetical protein